MYLGRGQLDSGARGGCTAGPPSGPGLFGKNLGPDLILLSGLGAFSNEVVRTSTDEEMLCRSNHWDVYFVKVSLSVYLVSLSWLHCIRQGSSSPEQVSEFLGLGLCWR